MNDVHLYLSPWKVGYYETFDSPWKVGYYETVPLTHHGRWVILKIMPLTHQRR